MERIMVFTSWSVFISLLAPISYCMKNYSNSILLGKIIRKWQWLSDGQKRWVSSQRLEQERPLRHEEKCVMKCVDKPQCSDSSQELMWLPTHSFSGTNALSLKKTESQSKQRNWEPQKEVVQIQIAGVILLMRKYIEPKACSITAVYDSKRNFLYCSASTLLLNRSQATEMHISNLIDKAHKVLQQTYLTSKSGLQRYMQLVWHSRRKQTQRQFSRRCCCSFCLFYSYG